jgi:hypothetical protein
MCQVAPATTTAGYGEAVRQRHSCSRRGRERGGSRNNHQSRTLIVAPWDVFLFLFSQKERPLRPLLSRNETGRAATRTGKVCHRAVAICEKRPHLLRVDTPHASRHRDQCGQTCLREGSGSGRAYTPATLCSSHRKFHFSIPEVPVV